MRRCVSSCAWCSTACRPIAPALQRQTPPACTWAQWPCVHRFGSSLNTHVHFHVCVVDGVFEAQPDGVTFHAAADLDEGAFRQVQANVRKRILRAFVARGHIEACDAKDMAARASSSSHGGGFSVDARVRIEAPDRAGLERLLRYYARPPFAMERLKQRGAGLLYRCGKGHTHDNEPLQSDKYPGELVLTPLELIERIAQLVPPPRTHWHRYYGVLAPNSPFRAAVTAMAQVTQVAQPVVPAGLVCPVLDAAHTDACSAPAGPGMAAQSEPQAKPKPRPPSHYLWAALIARIYEVFPLICPQCGGPMRIIAFITYGADIAKILAHIGVDAEAPRITPARGPPLWDDCAAQEPGEDVDIEPDWDMTNQSEPDYPEDQRTVW